MNDDVSPIVSSSRPRTMRLPTYEEWLAEKLASSLVDRRPSVAHDDVVGRLKAIIEQVRRREDAC